jgi:hypothetical protein
VIEVGSVETASAGVHLNLSWFKIIPGMSVAAKETNDQVFGEPIIDAQRHSSGRKVVAFSEVVVANADEITPAGYSDAPPVLWGGLQHRLLFEWTSVRDFVPANIRPRAARSSLKDDCSYANALLNCGKLCT